MNRLVDVDVENVHLVGDPANKRPFAIVKGLTTRPTSDGDGIVKLADLQKKIEAHKGDDVTPKHFVEMFGVDELVKAIGTEAAIKAVGAEAFEKHQADAARKKAEADKKIEKDKLDPSTRAYVEGLEKKVTEQGEAIAAIVKDHEDASKVALEKRVAVLKEKGFAPEGDSPTEAEVVALEKAAEKFASHLKEIGVLSIHGTDETPAGSAREAVAKAVREQLGREPTDAAEEARTRSAIYRATPGLLKTVLREERQTA